MEIKLLQPVAEVRLLRKPETVDHIRYLSTQAKDDVHYYIHNEVGYNYRMTNLQAALGVAQMEELPEFIKENS